MIKYRILDNKRLSKEWLYKTDGTKFWYWTGNEWWISNTKWTEYDTKATKPISKNELFLKLL